MSDHGTRNTDDLRNRLSAMSRTELERFAASAQLALDETKELLNEVQVKLRSYQYEGAQRAKAERVYHYHMCVAYHKDERPEPVRVPIPGGYSETVRGTERLFFKAGTIPVHGTYTASDMYRRIFYGICNDLNLSETEWQTAVVISWNLIQDELR